MKTADRDGVSIADCAGLHDPAIDACGFNRRRLFGGACAAATAAALPAAAGEAASAANHRFRYCLNTGTIRGQKAGLVAEVKAAVAAGYAGIEPWIGTMKKHVASGGSLQDVGKRCRDGGLTVCSAIGFARWVVNDDDEREKGVEDLKRDMEMVAKMGGTHIAAPPAGATRKGTVIELDRAAERYARILEIGRGIGVIPQMEVWWACPSLNHLAQAAYVAAKAADPDACILADVFHMYKAGVDPAALKLLGRSAVNCFHVNDYPADPPREKIRDDGRIWPGDGVAALKDILGHLAANHCDVMLSLELFNREYWKMPVDEAAKVGLAKMKAAVRAAGPA